MRTHNLVVTDDIDEVVEFHARVPLSGGSKSDPLMLRIEHPKYDRTKMKCLLTGLGDSDNLREIDAHAMMGPEQGVALESAERPTFKCRLWAIQGYQSTGKTWELHSHWYEMGGDTWDAYEFPEEGKLLAAVDLAPSDILGDWGGVMLHYDGSIKIRGGTKGKVAWKISSGRAEALKRFTHENCSVAGNAARMQIARPAVFFTLDRNAVHSPWAAFDLIKEELKDVCRLLSLCYRKTVDWYDINLMVRHKTWKSAHLPMPRCRRTLYCGDEAERVAPLIDRRCLVKGGFEKLLKSYRSCDKDVLNRVIAFLVAAYRPESLETRFFLCQAALEGMTNCLVAETDGNFVELNSLAKRLEHCVRHFGVRTDDLWKAAGFRKGLQGALGYRNRLFHGGGMDDVSKLYGSLVRFRVLTERLLIARLGWPQDMLWPHRDEDLHGLLV